MYLVSSQDLGQTWTLEKTLEIERDMREPYFLEVNGTLFFYYFEAGTNPIKFEPGFLQRIEYLGAPGGEDCEMNIQCLANNWLLGCTADLQSLCRVERCRAVGSGERGCVAVPRGRRRPRLHHQLRRRALQRGGDGTGLALPEPVRGRTNLESGVGGLVALLRRRNI